MPRRYVTSVENCSTGRTAPPIPADKPTNAKGMPLKLSGNLSMSMKYLKTPGKPPLYSGVTTTMPPAFEIAS